MEAVAKNDKRVEELKSSILRMTKNTGSEEELNNMLDQLVNESKKGVARQQTFPAINCHEAPAKKLSDPGCMGLAAFAITSLLGQMFNAHLINKGVVVIVGMVFGGIGQLVAGLLEFYTGNAFGFSAFTAYGAFWICYALILASPEYVKFEIDETDKACFMLVFLIFTTILMMAAFRLSTVFSLIFISLTVGFTCMTAFHFHNKWKGLHYAGTILFAIAALLAFYLLAVNIMLDVYKRPILPVGRPFTELFTPRRRGFEVVDADKSINLHMVSVSMDKNGN